jgi:hypothetical protein
MKLIIEKHPDIARLSKHFKKIEALADKMGIDVDELLVSNPDENELQMRIRKQVFSLTRNQRRTNNSAEDKGKVK